MNNLTQAEIEFHLNSDHTGNEKPCSTCEQIKKQELELPKAERRWYG